MNKSKNSRKKKKTKKRNKAKINKSKNPNRKNKHQKKRNKTKHEKHKSSKKKKKKKRQDPQILRDTQSSVELLFPECEICEKKRANFYCEVCKVHYCEDCESQVHTPYLEKNHKEFIFNEPYIQQEKSNWSRSSIMGRLRKGKSEKMDSDYEIFKYTRNKSDLKTSEKKNPNKKANMKKESKDQKQVTPQKGFRTNLEKKLLQQWGQTKGIKFNSQTPTQEDNQSNKNSTPILRTPNNKINRSRSFTPINMKELSSFKDLENELNKLLFEYKKERIKMISKDKIWDLLQYNEAQFFLFLPNVCYPEFTSKYHKLVPDEKNLTLYDIENKISKKEYDSIERIKKDLKLIKSNIEMVYGKKHELSNAINMLYSDFKPICIRLSNQLDKLTENYLIKKLKTINCPEQFFESLKKKLFLKHLSPKTLSKRKKNDNFYERKFGLSQTRKRSHSESNIKPISLSLTPLGQRKKKKKPNTNHQINSLKNIQKNDFQKNKKKKKN